MRYCSEDAPRTGERNVNLNKNTSENTALNKMFNPDERAPTFIFKLKHFLESTDVATSHYSYTLICYLMYWMQTKLQTQSMLFYIDKFKNT